MLRFGFTFNLFDFFKDFVIFRLQSVDFVNPLAGFAVSSGNTMFPLLVIFGDLLFCFGDFRLERFRLFYQRFCGFRLDISVVRFEIFIFRAQSFDFGYLLFDFGICFIDIILQPFHLRRRLVDLLAAESLLYSLVHARYRFIHHVRCFIHAVRVKFCVKFERAVNHSITSRYPKSLLSASLSACSRAEYLRSMSIIFLCSL